MTTITNFIATSSFFNVKLIHVLVGLLLTAAIIPLIIYHFEKLDKAAKKTHSEKSAYPNISIEEHAREYPNISIGTQTPYKSDYKPIIYLLMSFAILMLVAAILLVGNYLVATQHGLTTSDITISKMNKGINGTSIESVLPDDLNNTIVIYYKFSCPDCHAIHQELTDAINAQPDAKIYLVSTQSAQGKDLKSKYPVDEVPSGIYISDTIVADGEGYIKKVLYTTDENGDQHLNTANLTRLLQLQTEQR